MQTVSAGLELRNLNDGAYPWALACRVWREHRGDSGVAFEARDAYRPQKGGLIPLGIFMHIIGYWRSSRDYYAPKPDSA